MKSGLVSLSFLPALLQWLRREADRRRHLGQVLGRVDLPGTAATASRQTSDTGTRETHAAVETGGTAAEGTHRADAGGAGDALRRFVLLLPEKQAAALLLPPTFPLVVVLQIWAEIENVV